MMLCVVRMGPPPVMITNWSNPLNDPATDMINASAKVGRTNGRVIEKKIRKRDAPSIFAASVIEEEIDDNPAMSMIMENPNVFHATETLIMRRADHVEPSQFFPSDMTFKTFNT